MFNMSQVVVGPTHVHHTGVCSTIDLVLVSSHIKVRSCETLPSLCNSDHYGVLTQIELEKSIHPQPCMGRLVWRYNHADWSLASSLIENTNWDLLFFSGNIERSWTSWHQHFLSIMNKSIPNTVLRSRRNLPWLNKQLIDEVHDLLLTLDVTKSNGPDGISSSMLKHTADAIAPSLTKLFIQLGQLPSQWKRSLIVPIPKSSSTGSPSCYRPISLLPIVSKVLERHICNILMDHLQSLNFISNNQWGFLEGRSTVTALIKCTDDWLKELELGNDVCAIFFDFRKAFDSVPHEPLLFKLSTLNLDNCILTWLHN